MTSTVSTRSSSRRQARFGAAGRSVRSLAALRRRNRLVESHRDLVRPMAMHYARRCQESWEDLQQVGLLGLIRAAELYRGDLGTPFDAFARPHIRGAILHHLRDEAPSVRLPRRQAELQKRLQRLQGDPLISQGQADPAELRRRLGIDEHNWRLLLRHRSLCHPLPLEQASLEELAAPDREECSERFALLRELVARLDPRQRLVIQQVVLSGWSYRRLAARMQISPMTVQRLLHRGLATLRQQLEQAELRTVRPGCRVASGLPGC